MPGPTTTTEAIRAIETSALVGNGLLNPDQRDEFYDMVMETSPFWQQHRMEIKQPRTGQIDRMFIAGRKLRKRNENTDANTDSRPDLTSVAYALVGVTIDFDITEESIRYNIEGEGFARRLITRFAERFSLDVEDLHWNGDVAAGAGPDQQFLNINDGWLLDINANGLIVDGATINAGILSKSHLFAAIQQLPERYAQRLNMYAWIMTTRTRIDYEEYLTDRATAAGDVVLVGQSQAMTPLGIPIIESPYLGNNIVLANPRTFISVMSSDVIIRTTTEGREAIRQNKRLYAIHADTDPIIEEVEGVVVITDLA